FLPSRFGKENSLLPALYFPHPFRRRFHECNSRQWFPKVLPWCGSSSQFSFLSDFSPAYALPEGHSAFPLENHREDLNCWYIQVQYRCLSDAVSQRCPPESGTPSGTFLL